LSPSGRRSAPLRPAGGPFDLLPGPHPGLCFCSWGNATDCVQEQREIPPAKPTRKMNLGENDARAEAPPAPRGVNSSPLCSALCCGRGGSTARSKCSPPLTYPGGPVGVPRLGNGLNHGKSLASRWYFPARLATRTCRPGRLSPEWLGQWLGLGGVKPCFLILPVLGWDLGQDSGGPTTRPQPHSQNFLYATEFANTWFQYALHRPQIR